MQYDFLIIGGGIAGISAAARLAPLGKVLVLEAEDNLAHHASGRSAALYEPNYGLPVLVELAQASGPDLRARAQVLSPRGLLLVAPNSESAAFDHDVKDMDFAPISLAEARELLPILNTDHVQLAAWSDHAEDIDTDLLLQGFLREARSHGAEVIPRARISQIEKTATGWRLIWPGGAAEGKLLINAAGAWVDQVAQMAGLPGLGFTPLRRSMARIPAPAGQVVSNWPMLMGAGESFYMKPDAGALIVSPAEEDPVDSPHDAWADDMVLAEGLARYEAHVTTPVTRLISSWAGLRTFAPDRMPVIGRDPRQPAFFWLGGQGGYGFQTSPAISAMVADLIAERRPALGSAIASAVSPARFL